MASGDELGREVAQGLWWFCWSQQESRQKLPKALRTVCGEGQWDFESILLQNSDVGYELDGRTEADVGRLNSCSAQDMRGPVVFLEQTEKANRRDVDGSSHGLDDVRHRGGICTVARVESVESIGGMKARFSSVKVGCSELLISKREKVSGVGSAVRRIELNGSVLEFRSGGSA